MPMKSPTLSRELGRALQGAVFPLRRAELVCVARENDAPPALVTLLEGLPDRAYAGYEAVEQAMSRAETPADAEAPVGR